MAVTAIVIVFVVIALGYFLLRRATKRRDHSVNRYRRYTTAPPANKKNKMRRNRYHKTSRREPNLASLEQENEKKTGPAKQKPKMRTREGSDDPDIILGLKESLSLSREKPIPTEAQITLKPPPPPPPIISFHLMAEKVKPFNGYELLQAILSVNMRYGRHQIFHRHEEKTGHGNILFSLASVVQPGTFDLSKMGGFSTPGLSLFFSAGNVRDPIAVYELMLQTAGQLMDDLGGHVLDENHQLLTPTTVVHQRRLLHEYIEGQQVPDFFEEL